MARNTIRGTLPIALIALLASAPVLSQDIFDDFERADGPLDGDGWTVHSGDWNIVDGVLRAGPATSGTEQHAYVGSPPTSFPVGDYTVSVDMGFLIEDQQPVGRHAGVLLCMDRPEARSAASGYLVWYIDRQSDRGLNLARRDNGAFTKLVSGTLALDQGPPSNLRVEIVGSTISVFADDVGVISFDDDTYRGGHFGLWTWDGAAQEVAFDNFELSVEVDPLVACFTVEPQTPTVGSDIIFDAGCSTSIGTIVAYDWDFGDGGTAQGAVVEHTYEFPDNYIVVLTVEDDAGNTEVREQVVGVSDTLLKPDFSDDFDREPGAPAGWTVFPDSCLDICWQITDDGQLRGVSGGNENYLWAGEPPGLISGDVTIDFDVESLVPSGFPGVGRHFAVFFFAEQPILRWDTKTYDLWWIDRQQDFGMGFDRWDGPGLVQLQPRTGQSRPEIQDPPAHWTVIVDGPMLRAYGDGVLLLEVEDDTHPREGHFGFWTYSGQDILIDNVTVRPGVHPPEVGDVIACGTVTPRRPAVGDEVTFDASCTQTPPGVDVTAFEWDFGDGTAATGEIVTHTYDVSDNYVATLTVEHTGGDAVIKEFEVSVIESADLPFFDGFSTPGAEVPGWTVFSGDWTITEDQTLEVVTSGGGGQANEAHIWIGDPPVRFAGDMTLEFEIEFINHNPPTDGVGKHAGVFFYAEEPILRWNSNSYDVWWIDRTQDFGLGLHRWSPLTFLSPGTGPDGFELPEPPLRWRVEVDGPSLRVYGDDELYIDVVDETRREGYVGFWAYGNNQQVRFDNICIVEGPFEGSPDCGDVAPPVRACFTASATETRVGETITFDAGCTTAREGVAITGYTWDFGDGATASGEVVEHAFGDAGEFVVVLTVEHDGEGEPASRRSTITAVEAAELPIREDFEQPPGAVVEGWTVSSGDWSITDDGQLEVETLGGEEAHIWFGDPPVLFAGDMSIEFDIEFINHNPPDDGVGKHAGVFFFAAEPTLRWETQAYDVWWIDRLNDFGLGVHRWPLAFLSPGTCPLIEPCDFPDLLEPPTRWRIEIEGPVIRAFGDGELLVEVEDATRRTGHVGFWAHLNNQLVRFDNLCIESADAPCEDEPRDVFRRGDTNADAARNITDGIFVLNFLFNGGPTPTCMDAADANDDGDVNISDGVWILNFLFTGGGPPPPPLDECGVDRTDDDLDCVEFRPCQ